MHFVYMDESGDDGLPGSSPFFVLTAIYFHEEVWRECFGVLRAFRESLRDEYGIPISIEFHAAHFMLNKHPYTNMGLSDRQRTDVVTAFCRMLATLPLRVVNTAIDKKKVRDPSKYDVLDKAMTYGIQRIDNDMVKSHGGARFLLIVDEGRLAPMRKTTRRLQRYNYVPSRYGPAATRNDIQRLIEDPLTKDSKESYFIQAADVVGRIVYMWLQHASGTGVRTRTSSLMDLHQVVEWLNLLRPVLNLAAHPQNPFGIVTYPK